MIGIYPEWNVNKNRWIAIRRTFNWNISRMECKCDRWYVTDEAGYIGIYPEWNVNFILSKS